MDCNSFYCSCERLFRPDLNGKPVVVLSDNDGRLIALTPEAKALGFTMRGGVLPGPAPPGKVGVTAFSSNYTLYGDIFARVMRTLSTLVPIEQYSIDECFIPFYRATAVQTLDVGRAVHDRVSRWVGVPVRVGIGPTRTLAKLANLRAKNGPASSNSISIRRNWKRYWKRPPQAAYGYRPQTGRQTGADRHSQRPPTPGYGPGTNFATADRSRATNDA